MQILNIQGQTLPEASLPGEKSSEADKSTRTGRAFGDLFAEWTVLAETTTQMESPEDERNLPAQETEVADSGDDQNAPNVLLNPENMIEPTTPVTVTNGQTAKLDSAPDSSAPDSAETSESTASRQDAPPHWQRMTNVWQGDTGAEKASPGVSRIGTIASGDDLIPSVVASTQTEPKSTKSIVGQSSTPAAIPEPEMTLNTSRLSMGKAELIAVETVATDAAQTQRPTIPPESPISALLARPGTLASGQVAAPIILSDSGQHIHPNHTIRTVDTQVSISEPGLRGYITHESKQSAPLVTTFETKESIGVKQTDTGTVKTDRDISNLKPTERGAVPASATAEARPVSVPPPHIGEALAARFGNVSPQPKTAPPMAQVNQLQQAILGAERVPGNGSNTAPGLSGTQISQQAQVRSFSPTPPPQEISVQEGMRLTPPAGRAASTAVSIDAPKPKRPHSDQIIPGNWQPPFAGSSASPVVPVSVNQATQAPEVRKTDSAAITMAGPASAEPVSPTPTDRILSEIPLGGGKQFFPSSEPISGAATSATATTPMARYETARLVAAQLADGFPNQPGRPVEISLNPEELGRVRMVLSTSDTGVSVSITTDRPETLDLMRRHADQLSAELRRMGYQDIGFDFGGGGPDGSNHDNKDNPPDHLAELTMIESETSKPVKTARNTAPGGLDLRL